jgi:hypothetical protein
VWLVPEKEILACYFPRGVASAFRLANDDITLLDGLVPVKKGSMRMLVLRLGLDDGEVQIERQLNHTCLRNATELFSMCLFGTLRLVGLLVSLEDPSDSKDQY